MSDVDFLSAASDGWYALMSAAIDPSDATVATDLEEGVEAPLIILGEINDDPFEDDDTVEQLSIETIVIYEGTDRTKFHRLMHLARTAGDRAALTADGVLFGSLKFAGQTARSAAGENGTTYVGSIEHQVLAQPA